MSKPRWVAGGIAAFAAGALITSGTGTTYSSFSDFETITGNTVGAGVWTTVSPVDPNLALCADIAQYAGILRATSANETVKVPDDTRRWVLIGGQGNNTLKGGNKADCLIGGPGNNQLQGGGGADILIMDGDDEHSPNDSNDIVKTYVTTP